MGRAKRRMMRRLWKKRVLKPCAVCRSPATRQVLDERGRTLDVCEGHAGYASP